MLLKQRLTNMLGNPLSWTWYSKLHPQSSSDLTLNLTKERCRDLRTGAGTKYWSICIECTPHCDFRQAGKILGWILRFGDPPLTRQL